MAGALRAAPLLPIRVLTLRATLPDLLSRRDLLSLLQALTPRAPRNGSLAAERITEPLLRPVGPWRMTCLYRALTRYAVYRASGQEVRFVIGVRTRGEELEAHAWVERDGAPWGEPSGTTEGFTIAFTYPPHEKAAGESSAPTENQMAGIQASKDVLLTELKDGTGVLLDLRTKFYFTLNRTGVFVWKRLAGEGAADADALAAEVVAAFEGVDLEAARKDTRALIDEMTGEGLLTIA
jgi:hypothetical protein